MSDEVDLNKQIEDLDKEIDGLSEKIGYLPEEDFNDEAKPLAIDFVDPEQEENLFAEESIDAEGGSLSIGFVDIHQEEGLGEKISRAEKKELITQAIQNNALDHGAISQESRGIAVHVLAKQAGMYAVSYKKVACYFAIIFLIAFLVAFSTLQFTQPVPEKDSDESLKSIAITQKKAAAPTKQAMRKKAASKKMTIEKFLTKYREADDQIKVIYLLGIDVIFPKMVRKDRQTAIKKAIEIKPEIVNHKVSILYHQFAPDWILDFYLPPQGLPNTHKLKREVGYFLNSQAQKSWKALLYMNKPNASKENWLKIKRFLTNNKIAAEFFEEATQHDLILYPNRAKAVNKFLSGLK